MGSDAGGGWRVFLRYLVFQLPGWLIASAVAVGLVRWFEVRPGIAGLLFAAWVAKDFALYPFVRIAYGPGGGGPAEALVGAAARAEEPLAPEGWVRVGAELWRGRLADGASAPRGAILRVREVRGFTLLVEAEPLGPGDAAGLSRRPAPPAGAWPPRP